MGSEVESVCALLATLKASPLLPILATFLLPAVAPAQAPAASNNFGSTVSEAARENAGRGGSPFGLWVAGQVRGGGSDAASSDFQRNELPVLLNFVNDNLSERQALQDISAVSLDPQALRLHQDSSVRVYFLSEGAGYRNTLGYTAEDLNGEEIVGETVIFPDASSANVYLENPADAPANIRNGSTPLVPGDFVDLGVYDSGSLIDFFLVANGANGGDFVYTADADTNPDLMEHVVAFAVEGSPYLMIGFEDLFGGGDRDYNDLVFAVDIGTANVDYLAQPEPALAAMIGGLIWVGFWLYRRSPHFREVLSP
jgi:hypothetical protein